MNEMIEAVRLEARKNAEHHSGWRDFLAVYSGDELRRFLVACDAKTCGEAVYWARRLAEAGKAVA